MLRVLFVDDDPFFLESLRLRLAEHVDRWDMSFAEGPEAAEAALLRKNFDVVVSDVHMPLVDGPELLARVREAAPRTGRVILTTDSDTETVSRCAAVAHQMLSKPAPLSHLEAAVEAAYRLRASCASMEMRRALGVIDHLPTPPALYLELRTALDAADVDLDRVGAIVSRDPALVAQLLKLVNSALFGLRAPVSDVHRAIRCVGLTLLRGLVLKGELERLSSGLPPQTRALTERLHRHAVEVAELTASMVSVSQRGEVYTAGLLHDVGHLVMAMHDPDELLSVDADAKRINASEHCVERMRWRLSHAEIGAMLLELWAVPSSIREAVLLHHEPISRDIRRRTVASILGVVELLVEERDRGRLAFAPQDLVGAGDDSARWHDAVTLAYSAPS